MAKEKTFEHPPRGHVAMLYYDVANDRFQVVQGDDVDTAIPATAKALLASTLAHGYDGSAWRKQPPIWGYTDRLALRLDHTKVGAGDYNMDFTVVPPGEVWVLNTVISRNSATAGQHEYLISDAVTWYPVFPYGTPGANVFRMSGYIQFVLKAGDWVRVVFRACLNNDILTGEIWGYKMSINM